MALLELWLSSVADAAFVRPGRPNRIPAATGPTPLRRDSDGFNYGVTRPVLGFNAGLLPDAGQPGGVARTTYSGATQITGSSDANNPLIVQNVNISVLIEIMGGYVKFRNCSFDADCSAKPSALVTCLRQAIKGVIFERSRFRPSVPSYTTDAVRGHHVSLRRCDISNTVDGLGSFNIYESRTDNEVIGCVIYDLCKFDDDGYNDSPRRSGSHVDGTHNDCVQHQGGLGLIVLGNVLCGQNRYADGSRPGSLDSLNTTQCVLVQCNVAVGGVYYCDEIRVDFNWVGPGFNQVFAFITRASGANTYEPSCRQNTFEYDSTRYFLIRGSVQANINGYSSQAMGSSVTYPADGNKYGTDVTVTDASKRGTNVPIRRDTSF